MISASSIVLRVFENFDIYMCVCVQIFGPFFKKKLIKFQVIKCAFVNGWDVFLYLFLAEVVCFECYASTVCFGNKDIYLT